jgi:hypothetical protein
MTLKTDGSMSMSSVTEAPSWRDERSAARGGERRFSLRAPARIELLGADPGQLTFLSRRDIIAPVFMVPPLLVLGCLPWLAPLPVDATRAATSALFLSAAAGVAAWTWPKGRRLRVVARGAAGPGVHAVQPSKVRWRLDTEHAPGAAHSTYRVVLETDDDALTVLQSSNPEPLLWQFSEVLRHWPGPVSCHWGLPDAVRPWIVEPQSGPRSMNDEAAQSVATVRLSHRPLIWCTRVMTALVLIDLSFLLTNGSVGLASIHPLSVGLALVFASCLLALMFALTSGFSQLRVSRRVCRETSLFGLRRRRGDLRVESVRGVHALGSTAAERWHVLLDSADGPLALEVGRAEAPALAREVEHAILAARSGHAPRPSGSLEAVRTASKD